MRQIAIKRIKRKRKQKRNDSSSTTTLCTNSTTSQQRIRLSTLVAILLLICFQSKLSVIIKSSSSLHVWEDSPSLEKRWSGYGNNSNNNSAQHLAKEDEGNFSYNDQEQDPLGVLQPQQQQAHLSHFQWNYDPNKPNMVFHIGPPKTGTSTLQSVFKELKAEKVFERDKYAYGTKTQGRVWDIGCHKQVKAVFDDDDTKFYKNVTATTTANDDDHAAINLLRDKLRAVPCWNTTLSQLKYFERTKTSVFFSSETLAIGERPYLAPDWRIIELTILPNWNFLVIFAYRRYPEWIYSSHQQVFRYRGTKKYMNRWPSSGGRRTTPPFRLGNLPNQRRDLLPLKRVPYRYAHILKEQMKHHPKIPYRILNMHNLTARGSLASTFLCDLLPGAVHSCQYSLDKDQQSGGDKIVNPSESLFYDALAVAAQEMNMVNKSLNHRHAVAMKIKEYQEDVLKQTPLDFPLVCPTVPVLQGFLNLSFALEEEIVPEFAFYTNGSINQEVREEHISRYWKQVDKRKFCWIDTETTLNNSTWQTFLSSFQH